MSKFISIAKANYKQACAKSNVTDFWSVYYCRVIASIFVTMIRKTSITPNHLTYLSLIIHIIGVSFLIKMNYVVAPLMIMLGQVLDAADGQLAIIKEMKTIYGSYIDLIVDALKDLISYSILLWLFIGTEYEIVGIISLFLVSFSLILDWVNRHIINLVKPEKEFKPSNHTFREKFGIQFWTCPIRNFLIVISLLAKNPHWILIYSVTIGLYLTGKRYLSVKNMISNN
jgi:phosphatidylglycerophosphate synthase